MMLSNKIKFYDDIYALTNYTIATLFNKFATIDTDAVSCSITIDQCLTSSLMYENLKIFFQKQFYIPSFVNETEDNVTITFNGPNCIDFLDFVFSMKMFFFDRSCIA